ncbi:methylated-DNA--protein-cysteineS-methyltransferase [Melioribacter roseus P3M-2]|uniref:Methylated-DNA--protein-cysteine methyltransferase n=1 Tax=Melioribacter roseus (strain DSM 23840 / JCM 17771 / VKM B-2668 / P3M-2) TaxID=1191523 RepID=I7A6I4_MELRP|nr:methylated-DNA--[protein]-cysteine S-methyltransferase [Melioribacter roseus]AFN75481.1 methylated-DNA--protein-cysteineS-methyltransferase [Melioribacter roseus P3M-2]
MPGKYLTYYDSPLGKLKITADENAVKSIHFILDIDGVELEQEIPNKILEKCVEELNQYFKGELQDFSVNIDPEGTEFQKRVWNELLKIPYGKTISYLKLSRELGNERSIRAVARANGDNKIPIIIPCHRVIGSDKSLVGYSGGVWRKKWLLEHEAAVINNEKQLNLFF